MLPVWFLFLVEVLLLLAAPPCVWCSLLEASAEAAPLTQPVQGKMYVCRREPGENGQLIDPFQPPADRAIHPAATFARKWHRPTR